MPSDSPPEAGQPHLLPEGTSFRLDRYFYRRLLPGQDFLDANGFSTYAAAVERIRNSGKHVVLSLGESSTSGWDTTITPVNRARKAQGLAPYSAFFRYSNFTDLLRQRIGDRYEVLNAGVPGHTALVGLRRLRQLLQSLHRDGAQVTHVVIHYGNNDCLWEGNFSDRHHLQLHPRFPALLERQRQRLHRRREDRIVLRMGLEDFAGCFHDMVRTARSMLVQPILIQPEVPIYWEPGRRFVDYDFDKLAVQPGGKLALAELERARELWREGMAMAYSTRKIERLEAAVEHDFIVPRIKLAYVAALQRVARDTDTALVQTPVPRDQDEREFFVDYCHPREVINTRIADRICDFIEKSQKP